MNQIESQQLIANPIAVHQFSTKKQFALIENFHIGGEYNYDSPEDFSHGGQGGITLESLGLQPVQTAWIELGTRHHNEKGEVDNAILLCPYYSGDSSNMLDFWHKEGNRSDFAEGVAIGAGQLFDTDKYCIILMDALGLWGASRPAASHPGQDYSTSLGIKFPRYSMEDCVQLMYRTLKDKLNIHHLKMVTGVSLGGSLTYTWGVLHPNFMDKLLPIGGTIFQDKGMVRWLFDLMTAAMESDPVYQTTKGNYYHLTRMNQPLLGTMFGWSMLKQSAFVDEYRVNQSFEQYKTEGFTWEGAKKLVENPDDSTGWGKALYDLSLTTDANDMIWRNHCQAAFDVESKLDRIKAATLIFHVDTDQWIQPHIAHRATKGISGSKLITFSHDFGHYAVFTVPNRYKNEIKNFLDQ
jgi:homoserine acetyltransferase